MVGGLERCRALLKVGKARVNEGALASASVLGILTCRVTGGSPQRPYQGLGLLLRPSTCCPPGLDGRSSEAGRTRAWDRTGAVAVPVVGCVSGPGVLSKTVAFSDTSLSETLALS